jgi:thiol-disulfide isomerase/thioredoxin
MIINFWATWCAPCVKELNTIAEDYPIWQKETGVKLVAVSIDDARNTAKVGPFVDAKGWEYMTKYGKVGDWFWNVARNMPKPTIKPSDVNSQREWGDKTDITKYLGE